jgi:hypothetical protein
MEAGGAKNLAFREARVTFHVLTAVDAVEFEVSFHGIGLVA